MGTIMPGTLGNAKTRKTETLLSEKRTVEGKKGEHLLSKRVNPGGREEGIGECAVYQHKGAKSGCQCEECTELSSCPRNVSLVKYLASLTWFFHEKMGTPLMPVL